MFDTRHHHLCIRDVLLVWYGWDSISDLGLYLESTSLRNRQLLVFDVVRVVVMSWTRTQLGLAGKRIKERPPEPPIHPLPISLFVPQVATELERGVV